MKLIPSVAAVLVLCTVTSCQKNESAPPAAATDSKVPQREWLVEKLGHSDFAIARSYLDGFETLTPQERVLLYYLSRAAIAGRDIYYDQRHRDAVRIRDFFEGLLSRKEIAGALREKILKYAKSLWINNSHYHARTGLKLPVPFTYDELAQALPGEDLSWLKDPVFNPAHEPVVTNLTPKPEEGDIIQASATNIFARGVTLAEIEALDVSWKTKLNVRFDKVDGKIVPQEYKIGGAYGKELGNAAHFLKLAAGLAEGLPKSALEKLALYYENGDEEMFRKACIDWLKSMPRVDTINGFIESYMDPRQVVGSWEGMGYFTATDPVLSAFADNVQYFEDHMPWIDAYKRKNISGKPVATMINVATAIGEGGPITWSGINLPNYQDIRSEHGSKNVILINMIEARSNVTQDMTIDEFYLPEYRDLMRKYYGTARRMVLFMHEVIGHGSGAADAKLGGADPRDVIGKNYGAWEEARATLVAWHHIKDPKLAEMGAFGKEEQQDVIKAFALLELQTQLLNLKNARHEDILREAHDRADQLIFEYLRQTGGFEVVKESGGFYAKLKDVPALLKGASDLLKIVHEAKAAGDVKTVDAYLDKYGTRFNKEWRDDVVARVEKIGYPDLVAMIFAKLVPVFKDGQVVDVKAEYGESFAEQQMRYGRISRTTEVSPAVF